MEQQMAKIASDLDTHSHGTDPADASGGEMPMSSLVLNSDPELLPLALTIGEESVLLRLDPRTVRAMLRSGELDGNQRGHAIRVSRPSVVDWLRGKRRVPRSKR